MAKNKKQTSSNVAYLAAKHWMTIILLK